MQAPRIIKTADQQQYHNKKRPLVHATPIEVYINEKRKKKSEKKIPYEEPVLSQLAWRLIARFLDLSSVYTKLGMLNSTFLKMVTSDSVFWTTWFNHNGYFFNTSKLLTSLDSRVICKTLVEREILNTYVNVCAKSSTPKPPLYDDNDLFEFHTFDTSPITTNGAKSNLQCIALFETDSSIALFKSSSTLDKLNFITGEAFLINVNYEEHEITARVFLSLDIEREIKFKYNADPDSASSNLISISKDYLKVILTSKAAFRINHNQISTLSKTDFNQLNTEEIKNAIDSGLIKAKIWLEVTNAVISDLVRYVNSSRGSISKKTWKSKISNVGIVFKQTLPKLARVKNPNLIPINFESNLIDTILNRKQEVGISREVRISLFSLSDDDVKYLFNVFYVNVFERKLPSQSYTYFTSVFYGMLNYTKKIGNTTFLPVLPFYEFRSL